MAGRGISWKGASFYSHLLPSLDARSWERNRVAGDGWMAVGDAAGLVDPITGEGLYYAIRSGDLAAQSLLGDAGGAAESQNRYRELLRRDFAADLEFGSRLAKRVFLGRFLCGSVPQRMVEFTRRSPRFANVMQDLFAGRQPYLGLKRRLMRNLHGSLYEIAMSLGFSRNVPRAHSPIGKGDAGSVRRPPALPGVEAPADAQSARQPVRDRHEPRVQPHRAQGALTTPTEPRRDALWAGSA